MATIHPSRMALISQSGGRPEAYVRRKSPSPPPRHRSPTPNRSRSRERRRDGGRERENSRREYDDDRRGRDTERERDRDRDGREERRRASPQYDDYRRPAPPQPEGQAPWRQPENIYSNRNRGPAGGSDFMESRRLQRETMTANVWPKSPKAPARDLSPKRSKSSKKSKRARSSSVSDSSSEEERRRRERKERKRSRRDRDRGERRRYRSRSRSKSRKKSYDDDSGDDGDRQRRGDDRDRRGRDQCKTRTQSPERSKRSPSRHSEAENDEDEWVVKAPMAPPPVPIRSETKEVVVPTSSTHTGAVEDDESDDELGPQPLVKPSARRVDERSYGGQLLRGEGSAMAAFLQDGTESRIPRRGEIGLTSDEIAQFEDVGYVMSGSRHRRMNAVRMRKENQVISAEEKRGILKLQKEERARREAILREEFSELVDERLKASRVAVPENAEK
ncbi:hypothetical protein H0H92_016046 [Tricholoma furcatifolium]|nr:hypothetical protein H0H92_016046 [Tricholoma furcatifolium]